jgi:hypothetical protein
MNAKKFVNLTKFLLAGALVLGMTACSSDDNIPKGGNEENKVNTYMTVSITGDALQRTAGTTTGNSTEGENTIQSLYVILVNSSTHTVALTQSIASTQLTNTTESATGVETTGRQTSAFPVPTGTYNVYVVANPSLTLFKDLETVTTKDQLKTIMNSTALAANNYATDYSFIMTNAINTNGDVAQIPTVTVTSDNNSTANAAKPAAIHVDRLAAKIQANVSSGNSNTALFKQLKTIYSDGTSVLNDIQIRYYESGALKYQKINIIMDGYALTNVYKNTYLYQNWGDVFNSLERHQNLVSPNFTNSYASTDYDFQKTYFADRTKLTDKGQTFTELGTASYCLENNPKDVATIGGLQTKYDNEVTGVLFKAHAVEDGTTTSIPFYSYNGRFYKTLDDISAEYPSAFSGKYTDNTTDKSLANAKTLTTTGSISNENLSILRNQYKIGYYESGTMYYTYYIKDNNYYLPQTTDEHYYSIMRNSAYSLTARSLQRIGDDIPFGWTPDTNNFGNPIDSQNACMQIDLVVNKWVLNSYDIDLK